MNEETVLRIIGAFFAVAMIMMAVTFIFACAASVVYIIYALLHGGMLP